jgi:hypothetical protein
LVEILGNRRIGAILEVSLFTVVYTFGPRKHRISSKSVSKIPAPFIAKKTVSSLVIGLVGVRSP